MITHRILSVFLSIATISLAVPLTVHAAPACTLSANPLTIIRGQGSSVTSLTFNSGAPGVTVASVDNNVGAIANGATKSSITVTQTTTYTATITNAEGIGTCSVTVSVNDPPPPMPMPEIPSPPSSGGGGGGGINPLIPLTAGVLLGSMLGGSNPLAGGNADSANKMCLPFVKLDQCSCHQIYVPKEGCVPSENKQECPCGNTTSGNTTSGICMATEKCQGQTSSSPGGPGGAGGPLGLASELLKLLGQMKSGGGGGGGAGAGGIPSFPTMPAGCVSTYVVTQPSADPCAVYQPGGLLGGELGGESAANISDALLGALGGGGSSGTGGSAAVNLGGVLLGGGGEKAGDGPEKPGFPGTSTGQLQSNLTGDVRFANAGATIYANLREGITEVAGFFGGGSFGGSQSALSRMCASRPWAGSGLLASMMPDTFFDGLCKRAGYQVGVTTSTSSGGSTGIIMQQPQTSTTTQVQSNTIPPEADIWAEPASVRLGTRTFIFWNTRGVNSCDVTGPSFAHNTISGAASTVSITGESVFSIECVAPDGTKVSDSVTVRLAI